MPASAGFRAEGARQWTGGPDSNTNPVATTLDKRMVRFMMTTTLDAHMVRFMAESMTCKFNVFIKINSSKYEMSKNFVFINLFFRTHSLFSSV